jgi:signal transduction histidine kinase
VFSLRSRDTGVGLEVESEDVPPVLGDFDRLEQVLGNLLDNAFRHTAAGGSVRLSARQAAKQAGAPGGAWVQLSVADSGEGMPPEELAHVFDRFYKGETGGRGAGLGLAISREIVRAHGGEIRVESSPGAGTRFVVNLPASPPDTGSPSRSTKE